MDQIARRVAGQIYAMVKLRKGKQLKVLDLFSGIGGFSLGLERTGGFRTTAFCEVDEWCREKLEKHWPAVPIFEDVRNLHATDLPERPDVITGGYPCQPFSVAGQRRGKEDDRHLWPEIMRIIRELSATGEKPAWCVFENVAGHVSMGLDQVLADLEGEGYSCWPFIIPACALNANHRRDRVWIIANSGLQRQEERQEQAMGIDKLCQERTTSDSTRKLQHRARNARQTRRDESTNGCNTFANSKGEQARGVFEPWLSPDSKSGRDWRGKTEEWTTEPPVCGADDGIPDRVARLKALGNAVVPQIPELLGHAILRAT